MQAITLIKEGKPEEAFQLQEQPVPEIEDHEVLIKVQAFGLNYADVMARNGLYNDAPSLPCVLGYEVVGHIEKAGKKAAGFQAGQRVIAFTRFGAYAEYAKADERAVAVVPEELPNGEAVALATQYCTAYVCACEMVNFHEGDRVLIHAAAGGVGTALTQLAKRKGCIVFGTAGSDKKLDYLKSQGVDYPINYRKTDFAKAIEELGAARKLDVIFDPVGGKSFKKGRKLLNYGGRIITFGVSERSGSKTKLWSALQLAFNFGFIHPIALLMKSQAVIGVNMLHIGDHKPEMIQRALKNVIALTGKGELQPHVGGAFNASQIAEAHAFLENRESVGKVVVEW